MVVGLLVLFEYATMFVGHTRRYDGFNIRLCCPTQGLTHSESIVKPFVINHLPVLTIFSEDNL